MGGGGGGGSNRLAGHLSEARHQPASLQARRKNETVTQTLFLGGILLPDLGWKRKNENDIRGDWQFP